MKNKEKIFYFIIFIIIIIYLYLYFCLKQEFNFAVKNYSVTITRDDFSKILTTVLALISAVAFWLQFNRSTRLNESNYIMNMNSQFISKSPNLHCVGKQC